MRGGKAPGRHRAGRARLILPVVGCLLILMLGGCDLEDWFSESEQQQVQDTAEEWADAHGLSPSNEDGSVNVDGVAKVAKRAITGSTGDAEVDAALASDDAMRKIAAADDLEERGWKENDRTAFDKAVKLRPEDWKYYVSRAAWNINYYASPDMGKADADFEKAEKLLGPDKQERIAYAQQGIAQMEKVKVTLSKPYIKGGDADLFARPRECHTVFSRLAHYYNMLADQTGDASAREMAAQYTSDLSQCPAGR